MDAIFVRTLVVARMSIMHALVYLRVFAFSYALYVFGDGDGGLRRAVVVSRQLS
jgi:hypothetical protein